MIVYIDSREKHRIQHAKTYYEKKKLKTVVKQLETGDYVFQKDDKTVAFEYKTITDFVSSIYNNSLFEEASNQTEQHDYSYVIIEGRIEDYITKTWTQRRIKHKYGGRYDKYYHKTLATYYGALRRLRKFTCPILCKSEEHCFFEMVEQSKKCFDNKIYSGTKRKIESGDVLIHVLGGVGGVSFKRAEGIIKTLSIVTLYDLLECSIEDFKSVKGIGGGTAVNIYTWLHKSKKNGEDD